MYSINPLLYFICLSLACFGVLLCFAGMAILKHERADATFFLTAGIGVAMLATGVVVSAL